LALAAVAFGGVTAPVLLTGALATGQSVNLHFSRQHEEEADLLAYDWMKKLGRDPEGQVKMLEVMRRIARYRSDKLPQYLLTHPDPEARLNYIQSLFDTDQESVGKNTPAESEFEFFRCKYRILASAQDTEIFKQQLASVLADGKASEFAKIMASFGLSQVARNENDLGKSMALLNKVIDYFPDKNILKVDRAVIQLADGKLAEAEKSLREALRVDSTDLYGSFVLAKLLYRTGRLAEATQYFQAVSVELPEYPQVYFELGQIASDRNEQGLAAMYLGKYNLYTGKLKLAEQSLKNAMRDDALPEKMRTESKMLLEKIKILRK
jgi:predicted Zn-dependent protease